MCGGKGCRSVQVIVQQCLQVVCGLSITFSHFLTWGNQNASLCQIPSVLEHPQFHKLRLTVPLRHSTVRSVKVSGGQRMMSMHEHMVTVVPTSFHTAVLQLKKLHFLHGRPIF